MCSFANIIDGQHLNSIPAPRQHCLRTRAGPEPGLYLQQLAAEATAPKQSRDGSFTVTGQGGSRGTRAETRQRTGLRCWHSLSVACRILGRRNFALLSNCLCNYVCEARGPRWRAIHSCGTTIVSVDLRGTAAVPLAPNSCSISYLVQVRKWAATAPPSRRTTHPPGKTKSAVRAWTGFITSPLSAAVLRNGFTQGERQLSGMGSLLERT